MNRKRLLILAFSIIILLLAASAVFAFASGAYVNPPVERTVQWDSPITQELFYRACADCHSNETNWPWYSKIPPFSLLVIRDVNEGREEFNISTLRMGETDDVAETVIKGEMPPTIYLLTHPQARLTQAEKQALIKGLEKTFGVEKGETRERESNENGDDDD